MYMHAFFSQFEIKIILVEVLHSFVIKFICNDVTVGACLFVWY